MKGPRKASFPAISHLSLLEHLLNVKYSSSQEICIISYLILTTALQHQDQVWGHGSLGGCGLSRLCIWWLATLGQEPGPVWLQTACFRGTWAWTLCVSRMVWQVSAGSRASSEHERETGDVRSWPRNAQDAAWKMMPGRSANEVNTWGLITLSPD